jgi:uncharacterized protein YbjT (DUF2867 family)
MRIVVVGGTGRLGSQVVAELQRRGHDVVAAAPSTGFDTISGAGVAEGLREAQVVVDVSNSPSFEDAAQEGLVAAGGVPYTIIRSTQFLEFLGSIADSATVDGTVRLSSAQFQPIAASDLAAFVADVAEGTPADAVAEVAGPEATGLDELVRRFLAATGDPRPVVADDSVKYFGATLDDWTLTPGPNARLGAMRLEDWLGRR